MTRPRPAAKTCENGHRQTQRWTTFQGCLRCTLERAERALAEGAARERERWQEELGPPPAELVIRTGDGRAIVASIPKHLARGRRRRYRRGP